MKFFRLLLIAFMCFSGFGCATSNNTVASDGIQTGFAGINLGKIAFLPVFSVLNPMKRVIIDHAALSGEGVAGLVERSVLYSFREQPKVNGTSPAAVKTLLGADSLVLQKIDDILRGARAATDKAPFKQKCTIGFNYIDWYNSCLAGMAYWQDTIAAAAKQTKFSDAIFIIIINRLEKTKKRDRGNEILLGVAALLIDANTGNLIWGREQVDSVAHGQNRDAFPEWEVLLSRIFSEPFWIDFPGRTARISTK